MLAALAGLASRAAGAELSGTAQLATTATDNVGVQSDRLEQQYTLGLFQRLTPYVSLRLGYQLFDVTTRFEEDGEFTRRTSQPFAELLYARGRLSGRLAFYQQAVKNTLQQSDFERRSLAANLSWRPTNAPGFNFNYRRDTNVADVSVFGRDTDSRFLQLAGFYNRRHWGGSYTFEQVRLDNPSNALATDQKRHEARLTASKGFFSDRLSFAVSGQLGRLRRTTTVGEDTELAEPIPAVTGLVVVDTTPELGELEPNPTLSDGDLQTPASPPIDIGGANTFRNVGLDLGITRAVSRLEVAVDTLSGPNLLWRVYRSRDNLIWEAVAGATSVFDQALLRYTLRFPQTEDRFFKAVNLSVNPAATVLVTEVRALLDVDPAAFAGINETSLYRADVAVGFQPVRRINGTLGFGLSNDQAVTAGLVRRDFNDVHAFARLTVGLARNLDLDLGYRFNDTENLREPVLLRTLHQLNAGLRWQPLPSVDALLMATRRRELDRDALLQSLESLRLGVVTELLPDLRLASELDFSRLEDPFAGSDRDTWTWRETLEMRPLPRWAVSGGFSRSVSELRPGQPLLTRTQYSFWTTWNATAYLVLGGNWWYSREDGRSSLNQSYSLSYAPGNRLTVSASYQGFGSSLGPGTATDSLSATYRLFTRFLLFANLSRSRTEIVEGETAEISNLRLGLRLSF